jgi:hypothetical protein
MSDLESAPCGFWSEQFRLNWKIMLLIVFMAGCSKDPIYTDQDADGYFEPVDCVEGDPTIFPGAEDSWYDGIDQNCDGADDYDQDEDGFVPDQYLGLPTEPIEGSGDLEGGDCDDTNASVFPGADEVVGDGVDSNCNSNDDD